MLIKYMIQPQDSDSLQQLMSRIETSFDINNLPMIQQDVNTMKVYFNLKLNVLDSVLYVIRINLFDFENISDNFTKYF